jgi:hypothetical protein
MVLLFWCTVLYCSQVNQRSRVYPFIGSLRAQGQALTLPNLVKADMEVGTRYQPDTHLVWRWVGTGVH